MAAVFWRSVDRVWEAMASVKLTIVILVGLLLLGIPGTLVLQYNISNVDPGLQYSYDFWKFGQVMQLFTAYHSFWYVALMVVLSLNLVACSINRWPQMWKLANAKPVAWSRETFLRQPEELRATWNIPDFRENTKQRVQDSLLAIVTAHGGKPELVEDGSDSFQIFWQAGRWSRISNYLVHTSLLMIFAGAIVSSMYGFEGAANIPAGDAVDTFLIFKEGKLSGLRPVPSGAVNERFLGFRLRADDFKVEFYPELPGRPKAFISHVSAIDPSQKDIILGQSELRVNAPWSFQNFTFYQASYGRMNDFSITGRVISRKDPKHSQLNLSTSINDPKKFESYGVQLVALRADMNLQDVGPGVLFQEMKNGRPTGEPFWVLKNYPQFDFMSRKAPYVVVVDELDEKFFTGLQIAYDPGAPIYWMGCLGMLIGTFYALFVTHRKYHLRYDRGEVIFAGSIHRLPIGFAEHVKVWIQRLQGVTTS